MDEPTLFDWIDDLPAEDPAPVDAAKPHIYSVTELTHGIRSAIETEFADIWVTGEVSNWRGPHGSGHWYFSLKDKDSQVDAVMFRGAANHIKFKMELGMEVVCHGRVGIYAPKSHYQVIVDYLEPKGMGALQLAFEQLKATLSAEGLFDKVHKKPLPFLPRRVGVVTSPTGAAVRDICHVLRRRYPGVDICIAPVKVQGDGAAAEIAEGIRLMDAQGQVDVMIVGRGGGSLEDLWAFNEEAVARAIFEAKTPIVSAVGHEIDFSISDFVADVRAATPSAAAELVVPVWRDLMATVKDLRKRLGVGLERQVARTRERLHMLQARLKPPTARFADLYQRIDEMRERLRLGVVRGIASRRQSLAGLMGELQHLSPLTILEKGYAVVQKNGEAVRSIASLKKGDAISVRFSDGTVDADVKKLLPLK